MRHSINVALCLEPPGVVEWEWKENAQIWNHAQIGMICASTVFDTKKQKASVDDGQRLTGWCLLSMQWPPACAVVFNVTCVLLLLFCC
jgi:hypothetical protein